MGPINDPRMQSPGGGSPPGNEFKTIQIKLRAKVYVPAGVPAWDFREGEPRRTKVRRGHPSQIPMLVFPHLSLGGVLTK